jgi:prolipoprotein diacylglyceryltransferase
MSEAWWAVSNPQLPVRVAPIQMVEAAGLCVLAVCLAARQARLGGGSTSGRLFGGYLSGYALIRFFVEYFRGDQIVWLAGLTLQQAISLALFAAGAALLLRRQRSG